jgi:hypothetical protein
LWLSGRSIEKKVATTVFRLSTLCTIRSLNTPDFHADPHHNQKNNKPAL